MFLLVAGGVLFGAYILTMLLFYWALNIWIKAEGVKRKVGLYLISVTLAAMAFYFGLTIWVSWYVGGLEETQTTYDTEI